MVVAFYTFTKPAALRETMQEITRKKAIVLSYSFISPQLLLFLLFWVCFVDQYLRLSFIQTIFHFRSRNRQGNRIRY